MTMTMTISFYGRPSRSNILPPTRTLLLSVDEENTFQSRPHDIMQKSFTSKKRRAPPASGNN